MYIFVDVVNKLLYVPNKKRAENGAEVIVAKCKAKEKKRKEEEKNAFNFH